jgi:8-amino-7-oxononanoate synthase
VCGWTQLHQRLAEIIADFESTESAVLFPTGLAACSGTIATLAEEGDLILSDATNHASLIDGCRLSRAARVVYPHRDCQMVQQTLEKKRGDFNRVWIVTDGVFSMDGHLAPLDRLCDIADRYDACLIVDEAHGTGVLGDSGSGVCEAMGVKNRAAIRIGTLSKAVGSQGGFVAGPKVVIDYLVNRCRTLIYSTSLAPAAVSAAIDAFAAIRDQPERRSHVQTLARVLREKLSIDAGPLESSVPIIPVVMGEDHRAVTASARLAELGFFVPAIRPPTVAEGTARLRVSLSAAHDGEMVATLADAIVRLQE